jgi:hypothetical protein
MDIHGISQVYQLKKGTEQTHLYFSWYIPHICIRSTYGCDIHGIYHVYTMYIYASLRYTRYIPCNTVHHDAVLPVVALLQFYLDKCTILPVRDFLVSHVSHGWSHPTLEIRVISLL